MEHPERNPKVYAESRSGPDFRGISGADRRPARLVLRRGGGETQRLVDGSMAFLRRWIAWEEYEFYFYGKSRRTKVTGFRFVQPE